MQRLSFQSWNLSATSPHFCISLCLLPEWRTSAGLQVRCREREGSSDWWGGWGGQRLKYIPHSTHPTSPILLSPSFHLLLLSSTPLSPLLLLLCLRIRHLLSVEWVEWPVPPPLSALSVRDDISTKITTKHYLYSNYSKALSKLNTLNMTTSHTTTSPVCFKSGLVILRCQSTYSRYWVTQHILSVNSEKSQTQN